MKPVLFLAILILMTCCSSCELLFPKTEPKTELEMLPPITQEGKNTFGCLVNGKAFAVRNSYKQFALYQNGILQFGADFEKEEINQSVIIWLEATLKIDTYRLNSDVLNIASFIDEISGCRYQSYSPLSGYLKINYLDLRNFIISGQFEFDAVSTDCLDTIRITEGRFDMLYTPY
jgi:hypothetical protein